MTLSGETAINFIFSLPSQWWSTLQGKNLLPKLSKEQILSFQRRSNRRPPLEGHQRKGEKGLMTRDFTSVSAIFPSYQENKRLILIGCVQWNPVYG